MSDQYGDSVSSVDILLCHVNDLSIRYHEDISMVGLSPVWWICYVLQSPYVGDGGVETYVWSQSDCRHIGGPMQR